MDLGEVTALLPARPGSPDGWRPGDVWLAGGTWLFSEPQPHVRRLIDLTALGWPAIAESADGVELAATCTLAELARWPGRPQWPASGLPRQCCDALLGSFKVWNAATVGGNLCMALPAGPMISLAVALDATCTIHGPGGTRRRLPAGEFVLGPRRTMLRPGELLRSILLPAEALACRTALRQFSLSPLGRSAAVVIGRLGPGGAVFAVTASVPAPLRLAFPALPGHDELQRALGDAAPAYYDDVHGDPRWRAQLTRVLLAEVRDELAS